MKIDTKIGQYTLSQRTEYSKLVVFDNQTNENISSTNKTFANEITGCYEKQKNNPEKYFEIKNNSLIGLTQRTISSEYIFVPDGITLIDNYIFEDIDAIGISLPNTLEIIGKHAFYNCDEIKYIDIPDSVNTIDENAFEGCASLKSVKLPSKIKLLANEMFYDCISLDKVDIPDSVEIIGTRAFESCILLKNIKLPKNLVTIGVGAFEQCENLKNVIFPENLEVISEFAFVCCTELDNVILPDSVYEIKKRAFANCEALEIIKLPKNLVSLSEEVFANCCSLKDIKLPDNISKIESQVFKGTENLENINIPKKLYAIEKNPFSKSSIKSLTFNYDLENLDISFDDKQNYDLISESDINKLIINESVKKIAPEAFKYSGSQITSIEYLGTSKEFETFKNNNKDLFRILRNAKINIINNAKEKTNIEIMER